LELGAEVSRNTVEDYGLSFMDIDFVRSLMVLKYNPCSPENRYITDFRFGGPSHAGVSANTATEMNGATPGKTFQCHMFDAINDLKRDNVLVVTPPQL
jgi:hypothetical protein